jgi:hypothetical protein
MDNLSRKEQIELILSRIQKKKQSLRKGQGKTSFKLFTRTNDKALDVPEHASEAGLVMTKNNAGVRQWERLKDAVVTLHEKQAKRKTQRVNATPKLGDIFVEYAKKDAV